MIMEIYKKTYKVWCDRKLTGEKSSVSVCAENPKEALSICKELDFTHINFRNPRLIGAVKYTLPEWTTIPSEESYKNNNVD